jgi:hypothetical protein
MNASENPYEGSRFCSDREVADEQGHASDEEIVHVLANLVGAVWRNAYAN